MAKEPKSLDVAGVPELLRIAKQVRESGQPCVLKLNGEQIAILSPVPSVRRRERKSGIVTRNDSLWDIVGMADSLGPGDVARDKHKYLAEAYATKRI